jgi:murein L,D-transpeptidase YafK
MRMNRIVAALSFFSAFLGAAVWAQDASPVLDSKTAWLESPEDGRIFMVMNKNSNQLTVRSFDDRKLVLREYHAISGTNQGDKEREGDMKTPEGIYFIERQVDKARLRALHGAAAFELNYPNPVDKILGRTGSGIWIHGVDREERLQKRFDTLGCVAVSNKDVLDLSKHLSFRNIPVVIANDESPETPLGVEPSGGPFGARVQAWVDAWSSKNAQSYLSFYHPEFVGRGMPFEAWVKYKTRLTQQYKFIKVSLEDLRILRHGKYAVAVFVQNYESDHFKARSQKRLYLIGEGPEGAQILAEEVVSELPLRSANSTMSQSTPQLTGSKL